jgi:hypothetical protein
VFTVIDVYDPPKMMEGKAQLPDLRLVSFPFRTRAALRPDPGS